MKSPDVCIVEGDVVCEETHCPRVILPQFERDRERFRHLLVPGLQEESHTEILFRVHGYVVIRLQG